MKTTLFLLGVVALAVFAWWSSSTTTTLPVARPENRASAAADPGAGIGEASSGPAPLAAERREVALDDAAWSGVGPLGERSWRARFLVVDVTDRPVPSATITVKGVVSGDVPPRASRPEAIATLQTDAEGRAETVTSEPELVVTAESAEGRRSLQVRISAGADVPETRLVVERLHTLRGHVLREGGLPAEGARVTAFVASAAPTGAGHVSPPDPVRTDAEGAFTFLLRNRNTYTLRAELDGRTTMEERAFVGFDESDPTDVVLVFEGVITVRGIVLGPRGEPCSGATVTAWRQLVESRRMDEERVRTMADGDGRFEFSVRRHARYQVLARQGILRCNEPVWVEPSRERPSVETVLRLVDRTTIQGLVVGPDGSPIAGCKVTAQPSESLPSGFEVGEPSSDDLFGPTGVVATAADGSFEVAVHPNPTCSLRFEVPTRAVCVQRDGVAPGSRGLEFRLGADELAGCRIRGVVTRADGEPLGPIRVELWRHQGDVMWRSGGLDFERLDDGFMTSPIAFGQRISLHVELSGEAGSRRSGPMAPSLVGPIVVDGAERTMTFHLQPWASLPVLVVGADGRWATGAVVMLWPAHGVVDNRAPMRVDENGRARFERVPPGPVRVTAAGAEGGRCMQEIDVVPGANPELVVRLTAGH